MIAGNRNKAVQFHDELYVLSLASGLLPNRLAMMRDSSVAERMVHTHEVRSAILRPATKYNVSEGICRLSRTV